MEKTREALLDFITTRTQKKWDDTGEPFFVSAISPALSAEQVDYKEVIGADLKLTKFLEENGHDRFKVVTDPLNKARIGLIPVAANFEFPSPAATCADLLPRNNRAHAKALFDFLRALSELDDTEIDKINIPTSVLIKLLVGR